MDACEAYARRWAKKEDVELDTLSEWIKSIGDVLKRRIRRLKHSVNTRHESIFSDPDVVTELSRLHENFVIVPADKASNNYTFVCKRYYDILIEELGLHLLPGNPTYNLTDFSASEVLDNHKSVLTSFGIQTTDEELDLPYIYWIPKMHKNPYKHRFIAGSSKCSTKPLSILLTKLLTHIKQGLQWVSEWNWLFKARSIWYSGGAWDLCLGRIFFFGQYRSKVIFFAGPSGRIIFFITESYKYRGFRDNFMLIVVFATTICLIQAFTTNSGLIQAFATNSNSI